MRNGWSGTDINWVHHNSSCNIIALVFSPLYSVWKTKPPEKRDEDVFSGKRPSHISLLPRKLERWEEGLSTSRQRRKKGKELGHTPSWDGKIFSSRPCRRFPSNGWMIASRLAHLLGEGQRGASDEPANNRYPLHYCGWENENDLYSRKSWNPCAVYQVHVAVTTSKKIASVYRSWGSSLPALIEPVRHICGGIHVSADSESALLLCCRRICV